MPFFKTIGHFIYIKNKQYSMVSTKTIKFLKIREVKSPNRAYEFDAGIDFFVPSFNKEFIKDLKSKNPDIFGKQYPKELVFGNNTTCITPENYCTSLADENNSLIKFDDEKGENYFLLPPHARIMMPSGIKSRMAQPGRALIANNKSGIATKHGLVFGAAVVDYTYTGEIHISVINTSTKNVRIYENMKIIQFIETPVFNSKIEIAEDDITYDEFYESLQNDRGDGGFGSTDKK